ncbi:hypothetical protein EVAR_90760_1 [Eumeta japonica]|uniref:Uncharacterized protein n=1 Tax=Eumeta variegata TaxID=151549 RepID=A0A4C1SIT2_EUMVA|nr:hypothetical protein EVAR_90760_1 [Eumeta japonica]
MERSRRGQKPLSKATERELIMDAKTANAQRAYKNRIYLRAFKSGPVRLIMKRLRARRMRRDDAVLDYGSLSKTIEPPWTLIAPDNITQYSKAVTEYQSAPDAAQLRRIQRGMDVGME